MINESQPIEKTGDLPESHTRIIARMAVRSTVWLGIGYYLNQVVGFVANLALTRLLGPQVFGHFALSIFWSGTLNLRGKLGLNMAAIRHPKMDGELLGTFYVLDMATAVLSLILGAVVSLIMAALGYAPEIIWAILVLLALEVISALVGPLSIALEKEMQLSRTMLVSLGASVVAYAAAIGIALANGGVWSVLIVNIVTGIVSVGGTYWVCKRRMPHVLEMPWRFTADLAKNLIRIGVPIGLSLFALVIVTTFDNFLVGTFVGSTTLGYYDRAYRLAQWTNLLVTTVLLRIGFLTFAKVQDDPVRLTHAVRLTLWATTTLGIPIVLVLMFGSSDIVSILYGPKWAESAHYLPFLTIYSFVWPYNSLAFWLAVAKGQPKKTMQLSAIQGLTLIAVATPLTLWQGVYGTIAGVGITMIVAFVTGCRYVFQQVPLSFRETFSVPTLGILISVILLVLVNAIPGWNSFPPVARLTVVGVLATGSYLGCVTALRPTEMFERLRYLRQTWRKR